MDSLVIAGVPPYDGEYPLDFGSGLTNGELHKIKEIAGVRAGELQAAMEAGDNDLIVAFAFILLARAGLAVNVEALWNAPMGAIEHKSGDEAEVEAEGDARPPDSPTSGGDESSPDAAVEPS